MVGSLKDVCWPQQADNNLKAVAWLVGAQGFRCGLMKPFVIIPVIANHARNSPHTKPRPQPALVTTSTTRFALDLLPHHN